MKIYCIMVDIIYCVFDVCVATTREADRTIRKGQRELEKELYDCNRQEKDLISKIQAAHKQHKDAEVKSLARQLVRVREAKERLQKCTGQLSSVQMNTKAMAMNATLASSGK
jgi:division protein CdvB (Snf7/Vps24/ESCRT-III family)